MPGMNGWQVAKAVKDQSEDRGHKKPLFILLTGWANQDLDTTRTEECGVDAIVTKPVDFEYLSKVIERLGQTSAP